MYANTAYNYPQTYGYTSPPVLPQRPYYGSPYRPPPALTYQPAPLIAHPNATYYPPLSTYLHAPQYQFGGSDRGSNPIYGSRSVASDPYINANTIQDWAYSVHQNSNPPPSSVRSDVQYAGSPSHRSEKREGRDRRRSARESRRGSVYPPSYGYRTDDYDYKTDAGRTRTDGRSLRMDPKPNTIRREPIAREPPPHRSYYFYVTQAR